MSAMQPVRMVVMGVSGCGKSTVGLMLAQALGLPYVEGDDLHSPENVERMRSGTPLSDEQRRDWLEAISQRLAQAHAQAAGVVVSCSALKRAYRDVLRRGAPDLQLVHLHGTPDLLARRTAERVGRGCRGGRGVPGAGRWWQRRRRRFWGRSSRATWPSERFAALNGS